MDIKNYVSTEHDSYPKCQPSQSSMATKKSYTHASIQQDYDYVDKPDKDYFCPVSLELLAEPHQTTCCGHHISQEATNRLIREKKPCPLCKKENFLTQEDLYFKRKVRELKVYCPNKKNGCQWIGELGDHNHHTTSCPKRPWKCTHCVLETTYDIGINHTLKCDFTPLPCPNHCQFSTVPRCNVEKHLLTCPLQLVDCQFASAGCDIKVSRKDLASHMAENAQHHLMTATILNLELTRNLHQRIEEKDKKIAQLQAQLQQLDSKVNDEFHNVDTKLKQLNEKVTKINTNINKVGNKPNPTSNQDKYSTSSQIPHPASSQIPHQASSQIPHPASSQIPQQSGSNRNPYPVPIPIPPPPLATIENLFTTQNPFTTQHTASHPSWKIKKPSLRELCTTLGCFYKGYPDLENLCPNCYERITGHKAPILYPLIK